MSSSQADQPLEPRQQSLLRSSVVMASGTLVSRILGFIRSALLVAAIGVSAGAADAFQAANTLPNTVYNLLAAGVLDAILVPQIIRALKRPGGSAYLNKLITLAGTILFAMTVLAMIAAPLLISIMSAKFDGPTRALAITFALWCLPQLFFYGVYNLFGEILNARGIFGPYMWAPVVNNVVGIAGLLAFLYMWGASGEMLPSDQVTSGQILVIAGSATLGVLLQALCLLIPLANSGVKLRPDFRFKGTDFGSASKVAGWTFATLLVSQLGVISTTNLASAATAWSDTTGNPAASLTAYNFAFMIYMVPQSLIAVTLATAIFTRLANNASEGNMLAVARDYQAGVKLITMLSMLSVAILITSAVPMMQMITPNRGTEAASLFAPVLVALVLGIPSTGIVMISQRVFFAFEDAKPVFLMGIVPTVLQLIVGWTIYFTTGPEWWTVGAAAAETVCRVVQGFIAIVWVARKVPAVNAGKILAAYLLYFMAFVVAATAGWLVLKVISPYTVASSAIGTFFGSAGRLILVSIVVTIVFILVLRVLDPSGTNEVKKAILAKFGKRPTTPAGPPREPEPLTEQINIGPIANAGWGSSLSGAAVALPSWEQLVPEHKEAPPSAKPEPQMSVPPKPAAPEYHAEETTTFGEAKGEPVSPEPSNQPVRFNPTILTMLLASAFVIVGVVYSMTVLSKPVSNPFDEALEGQQSSQSDAQSEEPAPEVATPAPGTPVIASVEIFSWGDEGVDHPELAGALIDGNPDTIWYTRYYDWNQFEEDNTISILVNFQEESRVREVALNFLGGSGEGEITVRAATDGNPRVGDILATVPITEHTVIKLPENTDLSSLGINFVRLPLDDEGIPRAKVTEMTIN